MLSMCVCVCANYILTINMLYVESSDMITVGRASDETKNVSNSERAFR